MRFGYTPVIPPFGGAGQNESVIAPLMEALTARGGERLDPTRFDETAPLVYVMATGGTERALMALQDARAALRPGEPVILVAHPGNNSLPASLEVLARLQQVELPGRIVFIRGPQDEVGLDSLDAALADVAVRMQLLDTRIGLVGEPSDWLVASSPEADVVREVWGPTVVRIGMEELEAAIDAVTAEAVDAGVESLSGESTGCAEPTGADLADVARVTMAMQAIVEAHDLDAVSLRCFDLLVSRETTGCYALSALTDAGVIAGCEGDLVSTIGMLWANLLTGELPWMANPSEIDEAANTLKLAHCTVPRGMVERYRLRSHFESGQGVGIQGDLPLGPVTLLRLGGVAMNGLWLAEGEIVSRGDAENLCRTQVDIELTAGDVSELLHTPLGNHIVLIRGHHAARLEDWWETML
ncbi:MAG: fucose isomerase [Coriobacteriia bacterium]